MSEMKYKIPALPRYGLILVVIYVINSTYNLLNYDKLSGAEFVAFIVFLMSLLAVMVLLPESKYFKVGPSGFEFSRDTEGKPMKPKFTELVQSSEFKR